MTVIYQSAGRTFNRALYHQQQEALKQAKEEARQFLTVILPQIRAGKLLFTPEGNIISRAEYEAGCAANEAENEAYNRSHRL